MLEIYVLLALYNFHTLYHVKYSFIYRHGDLKQYSSMNYPYMKG